MYLKVHQFQGFLHPEYRCTAIADQLSSLTDQSTQYVGLVIRQKTVFQQATAMQFLYPLRIALVILFSTDVACMAGIYQIDLKPPFYKQQAKVFPVDPSTFHCNRCDPALGKPFYNGEKIIGKCTEVSYIGTFAAFLWYGYHM